MKEWIILAPKGAIAYSVAVPKPREVGLLGWVGEPEYPDPPDEPAYTVVTVYKDANGLYPPLECNGVLILVREASDVPPPTP